ncbi:MAG: divergent polysaccharide deacetylase family protein [Candidatus Omnitrophica bacterium]|nr:divergent polysaccharide deacetylase family protein [Candidatus Omnitrophota bacterium]
MAKKGKSSLIDKKSLVTTFVVLFIFALCAGIFLFLNKDKGSVTRHKGTPVEKVELSENIEPVEKTGSISKIKIPVVSVKPKRGFIRRLPPGSKGKIAFILDDWGYRTTNCHFLKEIKAPLAISILPSLRHSSDIMKCASVYDKDTMLHLPMEPYHTADKYPDYYLLKTTMSPAKVESILEDTFKKMPLIIGVNNHMGSKATEDRNLMKLVLKKIKKKGLFFVDSMTAPHHSVCAALADEMNLPFAKRDVFLDNVNTRDAIEKQMIDVVEKATRQGYAIAIGHDRTLTLQVLKDDIPILEKQGFEIVHIKDLLRNTNNN